MAKEKRPELKYTNAEIARAYTQLAAHHVNDLRFGTVLSNAKAIKKYEGNVYQESLNGGLNGKLRQQIGRSDIQFVEKICLTELISEDKIINFLGKNPREGPTWTPIFDQESDLN